MRFVGIQVKKIQSDIVKDKDEATQRLHGEITNRLQDILLDFGFWEEIVGRVWDEFWWEVTQLSEEKISNVETSIRLAYEKCLWESPENGESKNVIFKRVNSRSDLRLVFTALRKSVDFGSLREKRIWMLPIGKIKNVLENSLCQNWVTWSKTILMALRFCEQEKTLPSYDTSADALRHFLCDYVFCVPREELPLRTSKAPRTIAKKPRKPQSLDQTDNLLWVFFHGNDEVGAFKDIAMLASLAEISENECRKRLERLGLIMWEWVVKKPRKKREKPTESSQNTWADIVKSTPKVSLAGVVIPDELPDVSQMEDLPRAMREIFLLRYGYTGGDISNPASYDASKRMTRDEIAQKRSINKYSVYQTLQKIILRLKPTGAEKSQVIEAQATLPDDILPDEDTPETVVQVVPEPLPAKTSAPLPERIKPIHPGIPPDIESLKWLVSWLQQEWQVSLVRALKNQLMHAQGKKGEWLPSLGVRIFWGFTFGSLEARVLQLVHFFDSKKDFASFIGELKAHKIPEKPHQPKQHPIPAPMANPAIHLPPARALEQKPPEPEKPKEIILFGLTIPEFTRYEDFIAWASKEEKIVTPLITFYTWFRASAGSQSVKPGSLDLVKLWKESDGWKTLLYGTQLRKIADMWQVLLDICDIKPEPVPVVVATQKAPIAAPKKVVPIVPVVPKSAQDRCLECMITLEANQSWMKTLRSIAVAYQEWRFEEAGKMYETFKQEEENESNGDVIDAWNTLCDLKKAKGELWTAVSVLGLILEVCGYEFEEDPLFDYQTEYTWEERVWEYLVAADITPEALAELLEIREKTVLADRLKDVAIDIPLWKKKWLQWQEKVALPTNLWQFLEELLELNHKWQKIKAWFDIHEYKKLMRHIKFPEPEEA